MSLKYVFLADAYHAKSLSLGAGLVVGIQEPIGIQLECLKWCLLLGL